MPEDKIIDYPGPTSTGQPMKDMIFNWIVKRYKKHNHPWKKSDQFVFYGFIYEVLPYLWMIIWIWMYWILINGSLKIFGFDRTLFVALLFLMIRINVMIRQLTELNKKF